MSTTIAMYVILALLVAALVLFTEFAFRLRRAARWMVDHAGTREELERRLNHLDEQGLRLHEVLRDEAAFVLVAYRPFPRWRPRR